MLVCLSSSSREKVDAMRWLLPALTADGATYNEPQDHSFLYGHGFADLNCHI
ncbi:hypothetical protein [Nostoc sp. NMS8]|uniref:hypothetical protein n=1 Tax=Nostoc sp. NMS8 TaxID=2815392 RepID=UPI0025E62481|nr:hypothetical protein [Nostoc sp. NMS8]MBN3963449.1 hypothetical protein [Nostoc sp. NMS8]